MNTEHSDSDLSNSSWILLDDNNKKDGEDDSAEDANVIEDDKDKMDEAVREAVEEIIADSDSISVVSEPDIESYTSTDSLGEDVREDAVASYRRQEVAATGAARPLISGSTLTSAGIVMIGLLVALYFNNGYDDDDVVSQSEYKEYSPINSKELVSQLAYKEHGFKHLKKPCDDCDTKSIYYKDKNFEAKHYDQKKYKHFKQDEYQQKGTYRQHAKYEKDEYKKKKYRNDDSKKYNKGEKEDFSKIKKKIKQHEDYLYKKQQYLKNKEDNLNKKELKVNAKYSAKMKDYKKANKTIPATWYHNMYKERNKLRKEDQATNWLIERAQMRNKRRDKSHWYFDLMDEREAVRFRKH